MTKAIRAKSAMLASRVLLALLLTALTALAVAKGRDDAVQYQIRVRPARAGDLNQSWYVDVAGVWPTLCTPTIERVVLEGGDLRIELRSVLELCARGSTPYSFSLSAAQIIGGPLRGSDTYRVRLYAANGAQADQQLRAFTLLNARGKADAEIEPEAGFWWAENGSSAATADATGTLLSLEQQGRQLSVALMTYDSSGESVWRFGSAALMNSLAHVRLIRPQGGADPFAPTTSLPRVESEINLDLEFHASARATGWLSRSNGDAENPVLQLRELQFAHLPFSAVANGSGWKGDWVLIGDRLSDPPQRLRLDQFEPLAQTGFVLSDSSTGSRLQCQRNSIPQAPPQSCQLRSADGQNLGRFDSVAISRLDGVAADGTRLQLIRVSR